MAARRLYRIRKGSWLGGVCTGLAEYFNIDVSLVRILMIILAFANGIGLIFYTIAWIVIPAKDLPEETVGEEGDTSSTRMVIGVLLLILGVIFFVNQFFYIFTFDKLWPLILIVLGIYLIVTGGKRNEN